jgi:hypothetical protein
MMIRVWLLLFFGFNYLVAHSKAMNSFRATDIGNKSINLKSISSDYDYNKHTLHITWETASEIGTHFFVLQRSEDMETFEDVCVIKAAGSSGATTLYNCADVNPLRGTSFYRLKQINRDKTELYSENISMNVVYPDNQEASYIIPNPNDGMFRLLVPTAKENVQVKILDEMGQLLKIMSIRNDEPNFYVSLDLRNTLVKGKYYVMIEADETQHIKKMRVVSSW